MECTNCSILIHVNENGISIAMCAIKFIVIFNFFISIRPINFPSSKKFIATLGQKRSVIHRRQSFEAFGLITLHYGASVPSAAAAARNYLIGSICCAIRGSIRFIIITPTTCAAATTTNTFPLPADRRASRLSEACHNGGRSVLLINILWSIIV